MWRKILNYFKKLIGNKKIQEVSYHETISANGQRIKWFYGYNIEGLITTVYIIDNENKFLKRNEIKGNVK